jgi:hypothetical protein
MPDSSASHARADLAIQEASASIPALLPLTPFSLPDLPPATRSASSLMEAVFGGTDSLAQPTTRQMATPRLAVHAPSPAVIGAAVRVPSGQSKRKYRPGASATVACTAGDIAGEEEGGSGRSEEGEDNRLGESEESSSGQTRNGVVDELQKNVDRR